ncbi:MAG: hypothetical protein HY365_02285 [Candidatus Aenigmarchaeota archaeon]|nr:hypothetical protein [Candidatus Aenigmarchaeota archaeon]
MAFSEVLAGSVLAALGILCAVAPKWVVSLRIRLLKKLGARLIPSKKFYAVHRIVGIVIAVIGAALAYRAL